MSLLNVMYGPLHTQPCFQAEERFVLIVACFDWGNHNRLDFIEVRRPAR